MVPVILPGQTTRSLSAFVSTDEIDGRTRVHDRLSMGGKGFLAVDIFPELVEEGRQRLERPKHGHITSRQPNAKSRGGRSGW